MGMHGQLQVSFSSLISITINLTSFCIGSSNLSATEAKSEFDMSPSLKRTRIAFPLKNTDEEMKEQNASDESDDEVPSPEPTILRADSF